MPCCGEGGARWGRAGSMGVGIDCQVWEFGEQGGCPCIRCVGLNIPVPASWHSYSRGDRPEVPRSREQVRCERCHHRREACLVRCGFSVAVGQGLADQHWPLGWRGGWPQVELGKPWGSEGGS